MLRNLCYLGFALVVNGAAFLSPRFRGAVCPPRPSPVAFPNDKIPPVLEAVVAAWEARLKTAIDAGTAPSVQYSSKWKIVAVLCYGRYMSSVISYSLCGAVTYRNLSLASGAYGAAVRSPFTPATPSTLYRLASITKIVPTLMAYQAVDDGALSSLDAHVFDRVPDFVVPDPWENTDGKTISWRNLASHLAGLGRMSPMDQNTTGKRAMLCSSVFIILAWYD
jgi:hypothetical protein